ncbi:MAG: hypothetical protein WAQ98_06375 [Blastocatellia bacterium]
MKITKYIITSLLVFMLCFHTALAEDFTHPAGFKISVPDGWNVSKGEEGSLEISDPSEEVHFYFITTDSTNVEDLAENIERELQGIMDNYQSGEVSENTLNGLKVFACDVEGKIKDVKVSGLCYAFVNKKGKILLGFGFVASQLYKKNEGKIVQLLKGIRGV